MAWSLPPSDRDVILGDLSEEFASRSAAHGPAQARRWYLRQLRRSLHPNLRRRVFDAMTTDRRSEKRTTSKVFLRLEGVVTDLRDAIRALRATPGFTVAALVVLTLSIGATTAIFSVVDAVVLRGLPFEEADRLVAVGERGGGMAGKKAPAGALPGPDLASDPLAMTRVQPQNYLDWVAQQQVFESIAAIASTSFTLRLPGADPEELVAQQVTANFFDLLRIRPAVGRAFVADNETDGRHRVAILSDALWRHRFGGTPGIVGRAVPFDDGTYEVIGIMPPNVTYPVGAVRPTDLWVPYVVPENQRTRGRGISVYLQCIARLKPGVSIAQAQAQMDQVARAIEQANPQFAKDNAIGVRPLGDYLVGASTKSWMLMLLGAVAIVLVIACANVANLLLARASTREREVAVRAALGATRWRLTRQLMVESLVLSVCGTLVSLILAWWAVHVLRSAMPEDVARVSAIGLDLRVLGAAAGLSLVTGLVFGILPALQLSKPDLANSLKDSSRAASAGRGSQRMRSALVVAEVALAVVLLVGAALFIGSFIALMRIDPGFNPDRVLTVNVWPRTPPGQRLPDRAAAFAQIVDRVSRTPGVVHASMIYPGKPLSIRMWLDGLVVPGKTIEGDTSISIKVVTPDYHKAMRIPLRGGRFFDATDYAGGPHAAILNESAARKFFAGEDPVGRMVSLGRVDRTVVGVVRDVHQFSLEAAPRSEVYLPMAQNQSGSGDLVIHTSGDPYDVLPEVRSAVLAVIPDVPLREVRTMGEVVSRHTAQRRLNMLMLGLFGLLGLVISAVGIYGVMAYVVSQRTREIGVRMALGATRVNVMRMVLTNAGALLISGLIIGGAGAWYFSTSAKAFLFSLEAHDPRAYVAAMVSLSLAAIVASVIPARRAASVDPIVALRAE
jgi:putative ABC transport system permease protein